MEQVTASFEAANVVVNGIMAAGIGAFALVSLGTYILFGRQKQPERKSESTPKCIPSRP